MIDDETSIAALRARQQRTQWDPSLKLGVPLLAGVFATIAVNAMPKDETTDVFVVGLQLVPFLVLACVAVALNRWLVVATSAFLVVATIWMQHEVASSDSSTASLAYVFFPIELCAVPLLALGATCLVVVARAVLRRLR